MMEMTKKYLRSSKNVERTNEHYYRIGLCSRSFVTAAFRPGTKGGFCSGSNG